MALPLGMRASNSSSTRGRPWVMSDSCDTAGVERAHRQLGARLADRLRGDDTHRLADLDHLAGRQVAAVARAADALARLAHEHRAHLDGDAFAAIDLARGVVADRLCRPGRATLPSTVTSSAATRPAIFSKIGSFFARSRRDVANPDPVGGSAVLLAHDHVLGDVDQTPRQVPGVGGAERGVGEALARAVSRDEVLEHGQALGEVGLDRQVDDPAGAGRPSGLACRPAGGSAGCCRGRPSPSSSRSG